MVRQDPTQPSAWLLRGVKAHHEENAAVRLSLVADLLCLWQDPQPQKASRSQCSVLFPASF